MAKVYAKLVPFNGMNLISEVCGEYEGAINPSWTLIDEGKGSKFSSASTMYFPNGTMDEEGRYKYKFVEGVGVVTLSGSELAMQNKDDNPTTGSAYPEYYIADGNGTNIIVEEVEKGDLVKTGVNFTFIAVVDNKGNDSTINGVPLYKPNSKVTPSIVAGNAYDVWYDNDVKCFFIKASAGEVEGNAVPENVLASKTFSCESGIGVVGTMADNGALVKELKSGQSLNIPKGYHNGEGKITATGEVGMAAKGDALVNHVLSGKKFSNDLSNELTGSMPNIGTVNVKLNPNGSYQIPEGYHDGRGQVSQSIAVRGASTITPSTENQTIPGSVFLDGVQTILGDSNLKPENIAEGLSIFGVNGTHAGGFKMATGDIESDQDKECYIKLGFQPIFFFLYSWDGGSDPAVWGQSVYWKDEAVNSNLYINEKKSNISFNGDIDVEIDSESISIFAPKGHERYNWIAFGK